MAGQNQSVPSGGSQITPPATVAQQAVGGLVPLDTSNPTAGAPDAGQLIQLYNNAMYQGFGMPGATTMHMATPAPIMRQPAEPQMAPLQPQQVAPFTSSLEERRRARASSWGNTLGNALTMVANQKKQQAYQDRVTTLKEYQDARIHRAEAIRTLEMDKKAGLPPDKAAQQVLQDADNEIYRMENDKKQGKMLSDAMPNYADPKKDKWAEARKAGAQKAYEDDMRGLNNDTPEQKAVSDKADQGAGIPPPLLTQQQAKQQQQQQQTVPTDQTSTVSPARGVPPPLLSPNVPQGPQGQQQQAIPPNLQAPPAWQPPGQRVPLNIPPAGTAPQQAQGQLPPARSDQLNVRGQVQPTQGIPPGASAAARKEATGWQPKFGIPTKLEVTPEYSAAMAQHDKYQEALLTKVLPEVEKQAVEVYKVQTQQGNQNWRRIQQDATELDKKYMEMVGRANISEARNKMELDKQRIATEGMVKAAEIRAGVMTTALLSDPRFAPFAGVYAQNLIAKGDKQIEGLTQANRVLEQQIADTKAAIGNDPTHPGHAIAPGTPERQRLEEQIRRLNTQMEINMDGISRIQQTNANIAATAAQVTQQLQQQGGQGGQSGAPTTGGQPGQSGAPSGRQGVSNQSGIEWQGRQPAGRTPSGLDTSGGYQRWIPLVKSVVQRNPQFQNVPPQFVQAYLMVENRKGDQYANPQPYIKDKQQQGGQGMFQMIPSEQKKWGVTDPYNAENNTTGAMRMFSTVLRNNNGNVNALIDYVSPKDANNKPDQAYVAKLRSVYQQLVGGGGGTSGGAGTAVSANGQAGAGGATVPTGTTGATGGKPSAAIPAGDLGLKQQAIRETFGVEPYGTTPYVVPTSPYNDEGYSSDSSSQDTADDAADTAANTAP